MLGHHTLKTWSSTQPSVILSSGEAEFYGVVKAAGAALGHQSLLRDLDCDVPVRVWTDSSAALGICGRAGLGKLRHLETHTLWVQEKARAKAFQLRKVKGEVNPADLFTKHLPSRDKVHSLTALFGCELRAGRAETAPLLRKKEVPTHIEEDQEEDGIALMDGFDTRFDSMVPHDPGVLPHHYSDEDIEELFPEIVPAMEGTTYEDYKDYTKPYYVAPTTATSTTAMSTTRASSGTLTTAISCSTSRMSTTSTTGATQGS